MNKQVSNTPTASPEVPDTHSISSDLHFEEIWDSAALRELITSKSSHDNTPAFLFLGRTEASLLRTHLEQAFGEGSVPKLKGTYYMGLEVIEIDVESFVLVGGRKRSRSLQSSAWRVGASDSLWQLRLG